MRGTLLFLAGVLVGANAIYFLVARSGSCDCAGTSSVPAAGVRVEAVPRAEPAPADAPPDDAPPAGATRPRPAGPARGEPAARPVPAAPSPAAVGSARGLLVPVAGVEPAALSDTFDDKRGTDRIHEALDIMSPAGTAVVATADGRIEKLFDSDNGGLTIYQFDPTGTWCYYYAHLQRYAPGLEEGDSVRRGQVIGYVGSTGNASPDAPHLHFGIFRLGPERQWSRGTPVNPYPLLGGG